MFNRLRGLLASCGEASNQNERVTVLISACIDEGINTGPQIVGVVKALGFNPRHVGAMLKNDCGSSPTRHRWLRGTDGIYSLHE